MSVLEVTDEEMAIEKTGVAIKLGVMWKVGAALLGGGIDVVIGPPCVVSTVG